MGWAGVRGRVGWVGGWVGAWVRGWWWEAQGRLTEGVPTNSSRQDGATLGLDPK